jgi:hypothetical protein
VDDIAVETKGFLFGGCAGKSVAGAEAWSLHTAFLAAKLLAHSAKGFIALQFDQVERGDVKRGRHIFCFSVFLLRNLCI